LYFIVAFPYLKLDGTSCIVQKRTQKLVQEQEETGSAGKCKHYLRVAGTPVGTRMLVELVAEEDSSLNKLAAADSPPVRRNTKE
jgi:hypothetical protein